MFECNLEYDIDYNVYFYNTRKAFDFKEFMKHFNHETVLMHVHEMCYECHGDCKMITVGTKNPETEDLYAHVFPRRC